MKLSGVVGALCVAVGLAVSVSSADAGDRRGYSNQGGAHPSSPYYRQGGARVRGYTERRGGYSYSYGNTINTYGDSRTKYGGTNTFRDFQVDSQTKSGPFDHGFFFDGGVQQRGGDAPYLN